MHDHDHDHHSCGCGGDHHHHHHHEPVEISPVTVNGEHIEMGQIYEEADHLRHRYYQMMQMQNPDAEPEALENQLLEWSRENLIEQTLLRQEAEKTIPAPEQSDIDEVLNDIRENQVGAAAFDKLKEEEPESFERLCKEIFDKIRVERLLDKVTAKISAPKTAEMGEFYQKNLKQFKVPEMVAARHMLLRKDPEGKLPEGARETLEAAKARVSDGEDFLAVSQDVSSRDAGGLDLGWFPRGQMVKEFEEAVFDLNAGEMSDIIETAFGLHVAQNVGRRAPMTLTFDQAKDQIIDKIMQHKRGAVIVTHVEQLKSKAVIE